MASFGGNASTNSLWGNVTPDPATSDPYGGVSLQDIMSGKATYNPRTGTFGPNTGLGSLTQQNRGVPFISPGQQAQVSDENLYNGSQGGGLDDPRIAALLNPPTDYQSSLTASQSASMAAIQDQLAAALSDIGHRQGQVNTALGGMPGQLAQTYNAASGQVTQNAAAGNAGIASAGFGHFVPNGNYAAPLQASLTSMNNSEQAGVPKLQSAMDYAFGQATGAANRSAQTQEAAIIDAANAANASNQSHPWWADTLLSHYLSQDDAANAASSSAQAKRTVYGADAVDPARGLDMMKFSPNVAQAIMSGQMGRASAAYSAALQTVRQLTYSNNKSQKSISAATAALMKQYPNQAAAISLAYHQAGLG